MINTSKLDVILFGATGYTGKYVVPQLSKLAKDLSWGIAGRNEEKLKNVLSETSERIGVNITSIPIIVADVEDEESIKNMTARAKVIINCCGPFDLFGEVVVKCCIETGTHYVDVTGELQFIDRILKKYGSSAENKGVFIIPACGVEYVLSDLGICFMEKNWSGTINGVETFLRVYDEGGITLQGLGNTGSWASAINFIANMKVSTAVKYANINSNQSWCEPKLRIKLLRKVDEGWACVFPTPDANMVYRSQQYFYKEYNKRPIQMYNYIVLSAFKNIVTAALLLFIISILAQFKFGRNLLLQYPGFFTFGMVISQPSEDRMNRIRYRMTFKCQGWSEKYSDPQHVYLTPPNKEIIGSISGYNPGYGFTSLAVTLSALIILTESQELPSKGGVYTPAMAFSRTSMIEQLKSNGVTFKVLSIKDIP